MNPSPDYVHQFSGPMQAPCGLHLIGSAMTQPANVIFLGAGATVPLGIRATADQTRFLGRIAGVHSGEGSLLADRVDEALGPAVGNPWQSALFDLVTILGDADHNYDYIDSIDHEQLDAMRRNWRDGASDKELQSRIIHLRLIYDWPALKSLVRICPGSSEDAFTLNDLFNLLDLHIPVGFGVRAPGPLAPPATTGGRTEFLDARRLIGARTALQVILIALFYIDWQECIRSKGGVIERYREFAIALGRRVQRQVST